MRSEGKEMVESELDRVGAAEPYANTVPIAEEEENSIDLVELFQTLHRGRKAIFRVTLGVFAIATAVAFFLPPRYTSTVSFVPPTTNSSSSMTSAVAGQLAALGGGDLLGAVKNPGDLYAGILRSRSIASRLVKQFDLMSVYRVSRESVAEKTLASNTDIAVDMKSSIVTVNVTAKSPTLAHDIARAFMDALRETNGRLALSQSSQRRLFFEQQLAKEKDDLENAEVELKKTEEQSGLIAPNGQTESGIRTIAETQAQIALRQVQLAALRQSATEQNPDVIRLQSEIDDLEGQLSRLHAKSAK
jgi:tyrosine-protein kinase Etk/Wzc